jgi:hypothetical protein
MVMLYTDNYVEEKIMAIVEIDKDGILYMAAEHSPLPKGKVGKSLVERLPKKYNIYKGYDGVHVFRNISWKTLARTIANFLPWVNWATLEQSMRGTQTTLWFFETRPRWDESDNCWRMPDVGSNKCRAITLELPSQSDYSKCIIKLERI